MSGKERKLWEIRIGWYEDSFGRRYADCSLQGDWANPAEAMDAIAEHSTGAPVDRSEWTHVEIRQIEEYGRR